jgi:hypothetical protein
MLIQSQFVPLNPRPMLQSLFVHPRRLDSLRNRY